MLYSFSRRPSDPATWVMEEHVLGAPSAEAARDWVATVNARVMAVRDRWVLLVQGRGWAKGGGSGRGSEGVGQVSWWQGSGYARAWLGLGGHRERTRHGGAGQVGV